MFKMPEKKRKRKSKPLSKQARVKELTGVQLKRINRMFDEDRDAIARLEARLEKLEDYAYINSPNK